ncbi:MAG: hypothetical protein AAFY78_22210 [Cyanobacteria bacterium J06648_16]
MVSVLPIVSQPVPQPVGGKRLLFRSLDWQRYQVLREMLGCDGKAGPEDHRNVRFT